MQNQKHLFQLPEDIHYLNCAYMSPLLKSVEEKGIEGIRRKRNPASIVPEDFFSEVEIAKGRFGQLINGKAANVAVMPSVSYGCATLMRNVKPKPGQHALTISHEFPSGYFALTRWCSEHDLSLRVVQENTDSPLRGKDWNQRILEAITEDTAILLLSSIHWMDGTKFDLEKIGQRCKETNTCFAVDGTQSVGAAPMDVERYQIDALICGAYKWLLGPYSLCLSYFGDDYLDGVPIEESWMNRVEAEAFSRLTDYNEQYRPGAARYNVGQTSNFITVPMIIEAIDQILGWDVENIQSYCKSLTQPLIHVVEQIGGSIEEEVYRSNHLLGMRLPSHIDPMQLATRLRDEKVYLSVRGDSIRIAPHLYNDERDINKLIEVLNSEL